METIDYQGWVNGRGITSSGKFVSYKCEDCGNIICSCNSKHEWRDDETYEPISIELE